MLSKVFAKCQRIAAKCRDAKGYKPGSLFARSSDKQSEGAMYIYEAIGGWFGGVTADGVRQALDALRGVETLNIYINSEGGDVFEAKAIYAQLQRFNAKKVVHIDGLAASAATFIAMAGDEIVTAPEATWMIHDAWGIEVGNADAMRAYADRLDMLSADIAQIYSKRTGTSVDEMRELMKAETWMNAQEALDKKFTDRIASYGDDDDEEEDEKAAAKPTGVLALIVNSERNRAVDEPRIMALRAERAQERLKEQMTKSQNGRGSAAPRQQPASRS